MSRKFSNWVRWTERNDLPNIEYPGIYAIARSSKNIAGQPFHLRKEIIYFGMSNAKRGLKSRMKQFDNTIRGHTGHGGARRVIYKYDYDDLLPKLFVSVSHTRCDVTSKLAEDLRLMGDVARQEYRCFADYVERFCSLPEFNDKEISPKK